MNHQYDPHRAHPDTVLALIQWLLEGGFTGPMSDALPELLSALRDECRIDPDGDLLHAAKAYFGKYFLPNTNVRAEWDLLERAGKVAVSSPAAPPPVVAPAPDSGPTGAAAKESREDIAAPGGATISTDSGVVGTVAPSMDERFQKELCRRIVELEREVGLLRRGELGPGQVVPMLWKRVEALERAAKLEWSEDAGTQPAEAEAPDDPAPDACGCEQTEALEKNLAALRARNFDLATQLSRIRKLARRREVEELFEEIDREP